MNESERILHFLIELSNACAEIGFSYNECMNEHMNPLGQQMKIGFLNSEAPHERGPEKYIEDIPNYQEKLKAWEYVHNPNRTEIHDNYIKWYKFPGPENKGYDAFTASKIINDELGFPRTEVSKKKQTRGNTDVLVFPDIKLIEEKYQDILDSKGNLLPSRDRQMGKAA